MISLVDYDTSVLETDSPNPEKGRSTTETGSTPLVYDSSSDLPFSQTKHDAMNNNHPHVAGEEKPC